MLTLNSDGQAFSQAFVDAVTGPSTSYTVKLFLDGSELACDIMRLELTMGDAGEGMSADSGFQLGAVSSARMSATLLDCTASLDGVELEVRIGVDTGSGYEYATVAHVTVSKVRGSAGKVSIEAVGRIASVLAQEPLGLASGDVQPANLAQAIASASGLDVSLGAFASTAIPVHVEDYYTCRDALEALASALGGFATELAGGVLVSPYSLAATFAGDLDKVTALPQLAEEDFVIDGLVVVVPATVPDEEGRLPEDTLYTFGTGRITVTDYDATLETATALWNNVRGAAWRPGSLTVAALDPRLTPFDVASLTVDGTSVLVPARGVLATFDGGWFGTVSASGPSGLDETDAGPIEARVEESALAAARATANATRAFDKAQYAERAAAAAEGSAAAAQESAEAADASARAASGQAQAAAASAQAAQDSATTANAYANAALGQLSVVQDVVGVLDWASTHGTFALTSDVEVVPGKVYFARDAQTGDYSPVVQPDAAHLTEYYELVSVDEAMQSFIMAHLAVTSRGLWVLPSGIGGASDAQHARGYKVLLSDDGTYIYDGSGVLVALYGPDGTRYAPDRDWHVGGEDAYVYYDASEGSIRIGGDNVILGGTKPLSELIGQIENAAGLHYAFTWTRSGTTWTFSAKVTRGPEDITADVPADAFWWTLRTEAGEVELPRGRTLTITEGMPYGGSTLDFGYRPVMAGGLLDRLEEEAELVDDAGDVLVDENGDAVCVGSVWEAL